MIQPTKAKIQSNQDRAFGNLESNRHNKHILLIFIYHSNCSKWAPFTVTLCYLIKTYHSILNEIQFNIANLLGFEGDEDSLDFL